MDFIKKNYKFLFIFLLCFVIIFLFNAHFYDGLTQYGMAHAIVMGEVPYIDYNMVTTPLFVFLHAIFLIIYDSYLTYTIINSIISVLIFYYAEKIIGKHFITYFLIALIPMFDALCPSYNLLSKMLLMIIIYFEKENKSDFSIGILIGLLILTKHSVGVCILLCSLLYRRNLKGCINRIKGVLIPCLIFFIYLLITRSLYNFIDLAILGLFDFGDKNVFNSKFFILLFIILAIMGIIDLIKGKEEYKYITWYAIGSLSFMIPIFDMNHAACTVLFFLLLLFAKKEIPIRYGLFNTFLVGLLCFFTYRFIVSYYTPFYIFNYNHIPFYISSLKHYDEVLDYYDNKYPNSYMIDINGVFYDIVLDRKISYLDIPLTGNYGHRGVLTVQEKLEDDAYYFISKYDAKKLIYQFDNDLCDYVIEHSELVDEVGIYNIYHFKR